MIIGEDKTLNFAKVLKNRPAGKKTPAAFRQAGDQRMQAQKNRARIDFPYHIAKVRVEKGNMVFADLSLRPRFMTRIHDLKGTVTGLSSVQDAQAKVQMDGQVDQYGMRKSVE